MVIFYIIIILTIILFVINIDRKLAHKIKSITTVFLHTKKLESDEKTTKYLNKYQKKYLLTKNEWHEYKKLKQIADKKGLLICPKVRLLDIIEPRRGDPKFKTYLYKIQAKHIDFVICDQNLNIKALLELDDSSHNKAERQKRDEFIDLILEDVGYKIIRTYSITESTLEEIT